MIEPKCLQPGSFNLVVDGYGYLLPCCNFDKEYCKKNDIPELVQEKFNLNNDMTVEEVIKSEEWQLFLKRLLIEEERNNLPNLCHYLCGNKSNVKNRIKCDNV